ncbi:MAG: DMT family transporter [Thermoplasmatales archaeon]|nr:MAG: DMT family transporter [Thermoplasmatales archaeon]
MKNKTIGVIAILLASIMWAIEPIFVKLSYENSDFVQTNTIRAIFALLVAFIYVIISRKPKEIKISKKDIAPIIYIALVATLFADFMYVYSLSQVPVVNAVIIGHLQPIFIVIFGFFILKTDKLSYYDYIGIILLILSGILVTTRNLENLMSLRLGTIGDLFVLSATIAWATTAIATRKYVRHLNTGVLSFYRFSIAAVVLSIFLIMNNRFFVANLYQVAVGIIIGIGTILYYESLKRIKAAQTSALELSTPVFATILAYFMLSETPTNMQFIGVALLLLGLFFISRREK